MSANAFGQHVKFLPIRNPIGGPKVIIYGTFEIIERDSGVSDSLVRLPVMVVLAAPQTGAQGVVEAVFDGTPRRVAVLQQKALDALYDTVFVARGGPEAASAPFFAINSPLDFPIFAYSDVVLVEFPFERARLGGRKSDGGRGHQFEGEERVVVALEV